MMLNFLKRNNSKKTAEFQTQPKFSQELNYKIYNELSKYDFGAKLHIVSENTKIIIRPSGAGVLFDSKDPQKRLGGWIDNRLQPLFNKDLSKVWQGGFDPNVPTSGMTIQLVDSSSSEPILIRNIILESPEVLRKELYVVSPQGSNYQEGKSTPNPSFTKGGEPRFIVKNAIEALGIPEDHYSIVQGWSYTVPNNRGSQKNVKPAISIAEFVMDTLKKELEKVGIKSVLMTHQNGLMEKYFDHSQMPNFSFLKDGDEIDVTDSRWNLVLKNDCEIGKKGEKINIFEKFFAKPNPDSAGTARLAKNLGMEEVRGVAHIVDNQLGPIYLTPALSMIMERGIRD